jgi:hypothetical protein
VPPAPPSPPVPEKPANGGAEVRPLAPAAQRVVVAAADTPAEPGTKVVSSLASACLEAATLGVDTIELQFNGMREERPLDIVSPRLTIRNASGFNPTVVFRPSLPGMALPRQMIRIAGGRIAWQGVHLRLELPPEPADGWSLFYLDHVGSLDVHNAVVTVFNRDETGRQLQDKAAVFEIANPARAEPDDAADATSQPIPPHIAFVHCIARGQATLVYAAEATPFRIVCEQSLITLSQRFVDVHGARVKPNLREGRIDVVLKNVTAFLRLGLCRLSSDETSPHSLDLVTDCKDSIVCITDAKQAVIERRGVSGLAEVEKRLYIRGRDNFYLGSAILLRISPRDDPATFVDYGFEQRDEEWYQEESPRFTVMWKSLPPADLPADRHTAADYLLDASEHNPAIYSGGATKAGVDPSLLPPAPEEPARTDPAPSLNTASRG